MSNWIEKAMNDVLWAITIASFIGGVIFGIAGLLFGTWLLHHVRFV